MNKIWSYAANLLIHSRLNVRLFWTILLIMTATLVFIMGGLQYAFTLYDEQIYAKSSQVLMMSSDKIEEELSRVEEISYNIAVDPHIQQNLLSLQSNVGSYDFYRMEQEIGDELENYVDPENYIQSIYLYDSSGREYFAGDSSSPITNADKELALGEADQYEGKIHWMELEGYNGHLLSIRLIRSYENLNFENIGKLLVRVNLDKIVSELPKPGGEIAGNIVITKGEEVLYSEKGVGNFTSNHFMADTEQGYSIERINGKRTFVNHITTDYKDWTYWSIIPFNAMFSKITAAKYTLVLFFLLMFIVLVTLGFKFLRKITDPIQELASTMLEVREGNFHSVNLLNPRAAANGKEVGILYHNFISMIHRIDELIQENISKQLLIKETEFKALQAQINPHFLYNTLESVNWLAKTNDQEQISKMVEALGHLMRYSISFNQDIITLEEELGIVDSYLTIQKYRFEDRIEVQMDVPSNFSNYKIPKLILQPLLENTFKHAVEPSVQLSVIRLRVYQEEDKLHIRIEDNGPGIDPLILQKVKSGQVTPKGTGIGLNNIDDRIKLFAGELYGLTIENLMDQGTAITVVLPAETG